MQQTFLDSLGGPALFLITAGLLAIAAELGFRSARRLGRPQQEAQANVVTAALLGILGLLLAFSFGIVEGRFAERKALVVQEANAVGKAYLRASLIPEPYSSQARKLLHEYVAVDSGAPPPKDLPAALAASARDQTKLWREAQRAAQDDPRSVEAGLFVASVNDLIDRHQERVAVVLYQRLPIAMLITLFVVAGFSLALHGYSAGLVHVRVPLPSLGLIVSLSAVLFLIVELDRPWRSVFHISQDPLINALGTMSS